MRIKTNLPNCNCVDYFTHFTTYFCPTTLSYFNKQRHFSSANVMTDELTFMNIVLPAVGALTDGCFTLPKGVLVWRVFYTRNILNT